ncbi:MAG: hypothetical protein ACM3PW_11615, partial [Chlamydiota bacterium]
NRSRGRRPAGAEVVKMDCRHFETILDDLERDTPMSAAVRSGALQHAESCGYCRARLAAARVLSLELRALAREDEKLEAPAQVQASLLAAFRQRARRPARVWKGLSWAAVAAAVVVASWLVVVERPWRRSGSVPRTQVQATSSVPKPEVPAAITGSIGAPKAASTKSAVEMGERRARPRRSRPTASHTPAETAGEFIALSYGDSSYPLGDGMVVRVELPRSAPAMMGLPLSGGDTAGTVTADVVLGQDGVARAIRFVQPGEGKVAARNSGFTQN